MRSWLSCRYWLVVLALADQVTGTLTTGISATNGNPMNGIVITPPIASPAAGSYSSAQSVTLTAAGATSINYTTDGTTATCSTGNTYSGPIAVNSSMTIEAISCYRLACLRPPSRISTRSTFPCRISSVSSRRRQYRFIRGGGGGSYTPTTATVGISNFVSLMANWGKPGVRYSGRFHRRWLSSAFRTSCG